jgi:putative ABC transport system permease protein
MAAKRDMLWLLVWRALRLRLQRVSVVFAALTVGATIVTALSAVWFDINTKMSEELRTFGANFYIGHRMAPACRSRNCRPYSIRRRKG